MNEALERALATRTDLPAPLVAFLRAAVPALQADARIVGVAAGGSFIDGPMDEYSDLDLLIALEPAATHEVMGQRRQIAASLGPLLASFTGEHVGEPRVLICLYGPPPVHVDLKFVSLEEVAERVEDPVMLLQRDARLSTALAGAPARYPMPDRQWMEDRFWVWVHYGAGKIGRGELFEAHDFLAFLRTQVLGPLALMAAGARPAGVRKIEFEAPGRVPALERTIGGYDAAACLDALHAAAELYRELRAVVGVEDLTLRSTAERAAMQYIETVRRTLW